jgi:hypothetical protein
MKKCIICGDKIDVQPLTGWADGHNAEPVRKGRCCSMCNDLVVIPFRIAQVYAPKKTDEKTKPQS